MCMLEIILHHIITLKYTFIYKIRVYSSLWIKMLNISYRVLNFKASAYFGIICAIIYSVTSLISYPTTTY